MEIRFEVIPVGLLETNCYLIWEDSSGSALILDPGDELSRIVKRARELQLRVSAIALTHAHVDHAGVAGSIAEMFGLPVLLHPADLTLLETIPFQATLYGLPEPDPIHETAPLRDGEHIVLGKQRLEVRHTPGHSPGSVCIVSQSARTAWVGDLVFRGSVGRTDIPGGSPQDLSKSLREVILSLPDEFRLCPGHGPETTVGEERCGNPFLRGLIQPHAHGEEP
jgi:glyoxylase-like metal-dependent hydrolase (beta-lactamase superfamily II)